MCYEANRMPMHPDKFSESQTVSAQPQSLRQLLASRLVEIVIGCLVTSTASVGGVVYERIYARSNLERRIAQLEKKNEELFASLQQHQQSNLGSAQYVADCPSTRICINYDGKYITLDDRQTTIKAQTEAFPVLMSGYWALFGATNASLDSLERQTESQNRKFMELSSKVGNAGISTKSEQISLKPPESEPRIDKVERQIKFVIQRLDALNDQVQARIKADSR